MPATDKTRFEFGQLSVGIWHRSAFKDTLAFVVCIVLWLTYLAIYLPFLPTAHNTVGHDYSLHLPNLLTGYYWYLQNGFWSTPWFSPSQCGGFPFLADPNVVYYSATQLFVIATSPIRAVQLTFIVFSLIGVCGMFELGAGICVAALCLAYMFESGRRRSVAGVVRRPPGGGACNGVELAALTTPCRD